MNKYKLSMPLLKQLLGPFARDINSTVTDIKISVTSSSRILTYLTKDGSVGVTAVGGCTWAVFFCLPAATLISRLAFISDYPIIIVIEDNVGYICPTTSAEDFLWLSYFKHSISIGDVEIVS
jgi:hypothetical protein